MTWSSTVVEKCDFCGWGSTRGIDVAKPDVPDWYPLVCVCVCLIQIVVLLLFCEKFAATLNFFFDVGTYISYDGEILK